MMFSLFWVRSEPVLGVCGNRAHVSFYNWKRTRRRDNDEDINKGEKRAREQVR